MGAPDCLCPQLSWRINLAWISYSLLFMSRLSSLLSFSLQGRTTTPDRGSASPGTWPCAWPPADSSTAPCATVELNRRQTSDSIWRASSTKLKCRSWDTATRWRTSATAKRRKRGGGEQTEIRGGGRIGGGMVRDQSAGEQILPRVWRAYVVKGLASVALKILLQFIWYVAQTLKSSCLT